MRCQPLEIIPYCLFYIPNCKWLALVCIHIKIKLVRAYESRNQYYVTNRRSMKLVQTLSNIVKHCERFMSLVSHSNFWKKNFLVTGKTLQVKFTEIFHRPWTGKRIYYSVWPKTSLPAIHSEERKVYYYPYVENRFNAAPNDLNLRFKLHPRRGL